MKTFVAYYRVSTTSQGKSGLGLESQRDEVSKFVSSIDGTILSEFTDIESGKNDDRINLWAAVLEAHKTDSTLVVKKFDRLSRGGLEIMSRLEKLGINYIECDSPNDNTLLKEIKFSIARDEVKKNSERTKSALAVIRKKLANGEEHISKAGNAVKALGNPRNLTAEARLRSIESKKKQALACPENVKAYAYIKVLKEDSGLNFCAITKKLNESGFKTSKGNNFSQVQTKRIYERFKEQENE